jgi:hypothetical protein
MKSTEILKVRVSPAIKSQVRSIVERELLTEAAWLKRIVVQEVRSTESAVVQRVASDETGTRLAELPTASNDSSFGPRTVYVRFRSEDRLLLEARSEARGMRLATYVSVLTRAHLRGLAPLPKEEFLALRQCVAELAAIGRNINQMARAANETGRTPSSVREEFRAILKICEALRDNVKGLLKANEKSWRTGHV